MTNDGEKHTETVQLEDTESEEYTFYLYWYLGWNNFITLLIYFMRRISESD